MEVAAAASLWGLSGIFSVVLFRSGVGPLDVAFFRPLVATTFLLVWCVAFDRRALWPGGRALVVLWTVGGGVTALFQIGYQMAIEAVGVPATVGLLYLAPALVMLAAGPMLGEAPTRRQIGFGALAVAGVWGVVTGARGAEIVLSRAGLAWGGLTAVGYASYTLFGRWGGRRWPALTTVLHSYLGATVILGFLLPVTGPAHWPADLGAQLLLIVYGFATVALAVLLFYDALRRIPAARASIVATIEPVVAAVLASLVLGQTLTPAGWWGLGLVVVGVVGASLRTRARPPAAPS
jgi:DME family drug/metabolite transporter